MFGFLKKKNGKDKYLLRIAAILHENVGPTLPLKNAYNLAEECLNELKVNISSGMFHDGPNPKENIMAYYSMCSMVNEMSAADDKMTVLKLSVMTRALKDELGAFENMTSLEKGIWQFGEQVLADGLSAPSEVDVEKIKSDSVQIIMDLMKDQEVVVLEQDVKKIVNNVSANMVSKLGERILTVLVLSSAAKEYLDQGKNDIAYSYFKCCVTAFSKYCVGKLELYDDYQKSVLRVTMKDYRLLCEAFRTDEKPILNPNSREYFDIRLYSVMAHAARVAGDDFLSEVFDSLIYTQGREYQCGGQLAIKDGDKHVQEIIDFCMVRNFMMEDRHIQQYAMWILAEHAQNSDFSGILKLQKRQLEKGVEGATQEGIENCNKLIFDALEKYKDSPTIGNFLEKE